MSDPMSLCLRSTRISSRARATLLALTVTLVLCLATHSRPARAQLFVFDLITESMTTETAFTTALHYAEILWQWAENMLSLENYLNSPFEETVNGLLEVVDYVDSHFGEYGGIESYLGFFQDVPAYRMTECFSAGVACSAGRIAELLLTDETGIQGIKRANDRLFRGIARQQANLRGDAARLRQMDLRVNLGSLTRNQQTQAAAQLASEQANQLLQIRSLLIAQQQIQGAQSQLETNREARAAALNEALHAGGFRAVGTVVPW